MARRVPAYLVGLRHYFNPCIVFYLDHNVPETSDDFTDSREFFHVSMI
jgi:hypothetical protein